MSGKAFRDAKLGIGRSSFAVEGRGHWPVLFIYAPADAEREQIARVEPYFKPTSDRQGYETEELALAVARRYDNPRYVGDELVVDYDDESGGVVVKVSELDPHALGR
ncbi:MULTISPECIES: hypothetical protein [Ralstonia]|uniref:hypothetical protein n=1 Tax=Ralstonia TaxID=48736 RepID=UPI000C795C78|nr:MULTISPECIES: hypothetical protein [Ralstonia]PLT18957.1 hypothetical protein CXP34_02910 [Ralstonia mannitolilytica]